MISKAEVRAYRKAHRVPRRRSWRCWWTWPLGHDYPGAKIDCVYCGHRCGAFAVDWAARAHTEGNPDGQEA